ncbi:hypothetical protein [Spirillospora sp. NPDC029432]|uniref:hypothetical protein n=1 Tax=Spirillospora sp. NPDC029432 TaxID=3154599 RepID=UPI003454B424
MNTARKSLSLVVAALLVFAAGCAGDEPEARPTTVVTAAEEKPEPEPLTLEVAEREFRTFVTNDDVARAAGDERLALNWVSDGESPLVAAEYRKAAFDGDPVRRYTYGKPKLYVPKLEPDVFPQWFVASVPRSVQGEKKSEETAVMAFILRSPADHWTLSLQAELDPKAKLPKIPLDAAGYATALTTADSSVLIRPREMPGIHATLVYEGPDSVAAKVMRSGPVTTGYYEQFRKARRKARQKDLTLTRVPTATPYPIFQLRTEHGGGLVLYSLYRNSVTGVKDKEDRTAKPPIPPEIAHLLDGTVEGNEIHASEVLQFVAYDPARPEEGDGEKEKDGAAHPAKAEVIADAGGYYKGVTPPAKNP